jgi:hypothetical protein
MSCSTIFDISNKVEQDPQHLLQYLRSSTGKQLHPSRHQTAPTLQQSILNEQTYPISLQLYCENDDDDDAVVEIH